MSSPSGRPSQTERELVFCHSCENEWYRDTHGLICPQCQSDVVEIIEADHDPRSEMHEEDDWNMLPPEEGGSGPFMPTPSSGPGEGDLRTVRIQEGPSIQRTIHFSSFNTDSDDRQRDNSNAAVQNLLGSLFRQIGGMSPDQAIEQSRLRDMGAGDHRQGQQDWSGQNPRSRSFSSPSLPSSPPPIPSATRPPPAIPSDTRPDLSGLSNPAPVPGMPQVTTRQFRFGPFQGTFRSSTTTYVNGRRFEHSIDRGPGAPPAQDPDMMGILDHFFGGGMGGVHTAPQTEGGHRVIFASGGMPHDHGAGAGAMPWPLSILASLNMMASDPASARSGDFVFTDEALDRIRAEMWGQGAQSNAPGPANADAIGSLPRKKLTLEMIGEGQKTADCGICLSECELDEEVTELPCKHWFHFDCVKHWLEAHDSCPSCRRGIMPREGDETRSRETGEAPRNWQMPNLSRSNTNENQESEDASSPGASGRHEPASRDANEDGQQQQQQQQRSTLTGSIAEGFRNGLREWMGRRPWPSTQPASGGANTQNESSVTSSSAGAQRPLERSRANRPGDSRHNPMDLDSPDVD